MNGATPDQQIRERTGPGVIAREVFVDTHADRLARESLRAIVSNEEDRQCREPLADALYQFDTVAPGQRVRTEETVEHLPFLECRESRFSGGTTGNGQLRPVTTALFERLLEFADEEYTED